MGIERQIDLINDTSRRATYHVAIIETSTGVYDVAFAFGAIGASLNPKIKSSGLSLSAAIKEFNGVVSSKTKGDYYERSGCDGWRCFARYGSAPTASSAPATTSAPRPVAPPAPVKFAGLGRQQPNTIVETTAYYLNSPDWGAQEKKDGEARTVEVTETSSVTAIAGVNKLKNFVDLPESIRDSLLTIGLSLHMDGEIIGDTLHCFDLVSKGATSLADKTVVTRYNQLARLLDGHTGKGLELVPMAITTEEKHALYARIKAEGGEGLVYKRLRSSYTEGRPNSGGDALKDKFTESCSCFVIGGRPGKRSVELGLLDGSGATASVGNVTIPVNRDIPPVGTIVEIEYLYVKFAGGNLFQPVFKGVRKDMTKAECIIGQLKYKGVGVTDDDEEESCEEAA